MAEIIFETLCPFQEMTCLIIINFGVQEYVKGRLVEGIFMYSGGN